jgi:branched-chain amino acid transport system permease protein
LSMQLFIQLVFNGLVVGMLYVLIVLGLDIIMRINSINNFAHGQFYVIGAYSFYTLYSVLHINAVLALILSVVVVSLFGGISYLVIFRSLQHKFVPGMPLSNKMLMSAMASVGLMMILQQGILLGFGTRDRGVHSFFPQVLRTGIISFPLDKIVLLILSLLMCLALYLFMFHTKLGKIMRAVSEDADVSSLLGINSPMIYLLGFVLGCALVGFAGAIIAPIYAIIPDMGTNIIFIAMLVFVLGGIGSYKGAVAGGFAVGLLLSFGYQFFGGVSQVILFLCVLIFLIFRPGGILGEVHD